MTTVELYISMYEAWLLNLKTHDSSSLRAKLNSQNIVNPRLLSNFKQLPVQYVAQKSSL